MWRVRSPRPGSALIDTSVTRAPPSLHHRLAGWTDTRPRAEDDQQDGAEPEGGPRHEHDPRTPARSITNEPGPEDVAQRSTERDDEHDVLRRIRDRCRHGEMRKDQEDHGHPECMGTRHLEELPERLRKRHHLAALASAVVGGDGARADADPGELKPQLRQNADGHEQQKAGVDQPQPPRRLRERELSPGKISHQAAPTASNANHPVAPMPSPS